MIKQPRQRQRMLNLEAGMQMCMVEVERQQNEINKLRGQVNNLAQAGMIAVMVSEKLNEAVQSLSNTDVRTEERVRELALTVNSLGVQCASHEVMIDHVNDLTRRLPCVEKRVGCEQAEAVEQRKQKERELDVG